MDCRIAPGSNSRAVNEDLTPPAHHPLDAQGFNLPFRLRQHGPFNRSPRPDERHGRIGRLPAKLLGQRQRRVHVSSGPTCGNHDVHPIRHANPRWYTGTARDTLSSIPMAPRLTSNDDPP